MNIAGGGGKTFMFYWTKFAWRSGPHFSLNKCAL